MLFVFPFHMQFCTGVTRSGICPRVHGQMFVKDCIPDTVNRTLWSLLRMMAASPITTHFDRSEKSFLSHSFQQCLHALGLDFAFNSYFIKQFSFITKLIATQPFSNQECNFFFLHSSSDMFCFYLKINTFNVVVFLFCIRINQIQFNIGRSLS